MAERNRYTKRAFNSYAEIRKFTARGRAKSGGRAFGGGCKLQIINKDMDSEHITLSRDDRHAATITPDNMITILEHSFGTMLDRAFGIGSRVFRRQRVVVLNDNLRTKRRATWLPNNLHAPDVGTTVSRYYTGIRVDLSKYEFVNPRKLSRKETDKDQALKWKRKLARARKQTVILASLSEFEKEVWKVKNRSDTYALIHNNWSALKADMFYDAVIDEDYKTLMQMVAYQVALRPWLHRNDRVSPHEMRQAFDFIYASVRADVRELAGAIKTVDETNVKRTELPNTQAQA